MSELWSEVPRSDVKPATDRVVAELAAAQWGVVARRQLTAAGVTPMMIERRLANDRLIPLHRGVYAVGHRQLRREGHWLAAVLAVPGSVLSHRDAAGLHGLRSANHANVDVTTTGRALTHARIAVHRTRTLEARDIATVNGIPVTSAARTLVDLAALIPSDQLANALRAAEQQQTLDMGAIKDTLARTRGRTGPGHKATKEALAELEALATTLTRSSLEAGFQRLINTHALPKPQTNVPIEGHQVDAVWPDHKLIVELDGWEWHRSRHAFQNDRERDIRLQLAGYRILRFTHDHIVRRPHEVATAVRQALAP